MVQTSGASLFGLWAGGLRVSSNAGEQFVSGSDDFVESILWLNSEYLGASWFANLKHEMGELDNLAKNLYGRVFGFYKAQKVDGAPLAAQATTEFWQLVERDFQALLDSCDVEEKHTLARYRLRRCFAGYVHRTYDRFCPKDTARQLDAWASNRPNISKYLTSET